MLRFSFLLSTCLYFSSFIVHCNGFESNPSGIPILIWDLEKPLLEIPAAYSVNLPYLLKYLEDFASKNILLFNQDILGVEDLSSHKDVFKNVKNSIEGHRSLYFPAAEFKSSLPHSLSSHGYKVTYLEPGSDVGELRLNENEKNLVVVEPPSTITNPSRKNALQKTDEIIGNVLSKIGSKANFTVIFTGKEPSVKTDYDTEHIRIARSLKQHQESKDKRYHWSKCAIMFLWSDIYVKRTDGNSTKEYFLYNNNTRENSGDCHNETTSLIIMYRDIPHFDQPNMPNLRFNFVRRSFQWTLENVRYRFPEATEGRIFLYPTWPKEYVPMRFSFACSRKLILKTNATDTPQYQMIINGVQVQAYTKETATGFGPAWDCVGFYTIPIWTGVLAAIIMVIILAVGMHMLSQIKTMDRFDDPKGKHIMVTGASE